MERLGRNLLTGTRDFSGEWNTRDIWRNDGEYNQLIVKSSNTRYNGEGIKVIIDPVTYTFSCYAKGNEDSTYQIWIPSGGGDDPNLNFIKPKYNTTIRLTSEWVRYSYTFEFTGSNSITICPRFEKTSDDESTTYVCGYKLERGSIATPWTPAPEDQFGRNLFIMKTSVHGFLSDNNNGTITNYSGNGETTSDYILVNPGEVFTIQTWATSNNIDSQYYTIHFQWFTDKAAVNHIGDKIIYRGGQPGFNHATVTTGPAPDTAKYVRVTARLYADGKIKVERGSVATHYSPAPEDSPSFSQCYLTRRASGRSITNAVVQLDRDSFVYDGSEHVPKVTSVTLEGKALTEGKDYTCASTPATDAGRYHVFVKGAKSYKGTIAVPWRIEKAAGSVRVSPSSVTLFGLAGETATAELTVTGDGEIAFGASEYVTLSREGNTLTVTSVSTGIGTVDVILKDGLNYTGARTTLNVDVTLVDTVLENNSWQTIDTVAAAGRAKEFWKIGDKKSVTRNGETYNFQIAAFNHFDLSEEDERYSDPNYNHGAKKAAIAFVQEETFEDRFRMKSYDFSGYYTGYTQSDFYKNDLPTILSELDDAFVSIVKNVVIKTSFRESENDSIQVILNEKFFLLGTKEVLEGGNNRFSNDGEILEYFKSGNSPIRYNKEGAAISYWLRSRYVYFIQNAAALIDTEGNIKNVPSTYSENIILAFCI